MKVPIIEQIHVDTQQAEKHLKSKQEQLAAAHESRGAVRQEIDESTGSLQHLQTQLRKVVEEKEDIQLELDEKIKMCEILQRLQDQYNKRWRKSKDDVELLKKLVQEKEQEVKKLKGDLEIKHHELYDLQQALKQIQQNLSQKTIELDKKTSQVVQLEKEVEQLTIKLSNKGKELDMEMQQRTAKANSHAEYIGEMKVIYILHGLIIVHLPLLNYYHYADTVLYLVNMFLV